MKTETAKEILLVIFPSTEFPVSGLLWCAGDCPAEQCRNHLGEEDDEKDPSVELDSCREEEREKTR